MNEKNQIVQVTYRSSERTKKLFDKYCSETARLSKPQLIDIAFEFMAMWPEKIIDDCIWLILKGDLEGARDKIKVVARNSPPLK